MAVEIQELRAVVRAEIEQFEQRMNKAGADAESFEGRWSRVGAGVVRTATAITTAVVGIGTAMSAAAIKFIESGEEQRKAVARLDTVFKATGHSAGITTQRVLEFAAARQAVTNFGDEVTVQGAAILATFQSVRGEAFFQTLTLAQDLAELMGGDFEGAVRKLGVAMESPTTGLRGLREAGVVFTSQQREVIKSLVESNRLHEAQAMILAAVQGRIGGTAVAAQSPLTAMRNVISDLAEDIGLSLLPAFTAFANDVGQFIRENRPQIISLAQSFLEFGLSISRFLVNHPKLASFLGLLAVGKLTGINSAIGSMTGAIGTASKGFGTFSQAGGAAVSSIRSIGSAAMLLKGGLVTLAVAGIAAVSVAIYKLMPSIRAWNRETERAAELNKQIADRADKGRDAILKQADAIQDPGQREAFLQQQLELAEKNLAGMESSLAGATKQYDDYNNGWREFTGNKVLADFESQVQETTAAVERQKALIESIRAEAEAAGGLAQPVQPVAGLDGETEPVPQAIPDAIPVTVEPAAVDAATTQPTGQEAVQAALPDLLQFGTLLDSLKGTVPVAELDQFAQRGLMLKDALASGKITAEQFEVGLRQLTDATNAAADAANVEAEAKRQQALVAGDFAGAGLDFDKAVQEQAAAIQLQQFNQQVADAARKMLGLNEASAGVNDTFSTLEHDVSKFGDQIQDFGGKVGDFAGDMKANGQQIAQGMSALGEFLNSRNGQIVSLQNQISSLQQLLSLESLGYRRRQEIISQIEAIANQITGLMQASPDVLGVWRSDPVFTDPGLEGASTSSGSRVGPPNVIVNSIFPPSAADRRMLVAAVVEELSRSGWRV